MIKKLEIENFQSHDETSLDFHPGVNVIIGQSDSGKTAILRALDWVCNNKPSGDDFRSDWGGDTRVILHTPDGKIIREKKGKTGNTYYLEMNGSIQEYKSFNKGVPPDILEELNLISLNWQRQHDAPFLLSSTPGEVASTLNQIVHLDVIDSSLSCAMAKIRAVSQELSSQKELLSQAEEDLTKFDSLPDLEKKLLVVEEWNRKGNEVEDEHKDILFILDKISVAENKIKTLEKYEKADSYVKEIDKKMERKTEINVEVIKLNGIIDATQEARSSIDEANILADLSQPVEAILDLQNKVDGRRIKEKGLCTFITEILKIESFIESVEEKIEMMEQRMPDVCPICGGKL